MTRQHYFIGSLGPFFYEDGTLLPDGSGRYQTAIDSPDGYIGALVTVNLVFQELKAVDNSCILLGTEEDICIKFDGTSLVIEDIAAADLFTIHGTSGLTTVKNNAQVDGTLTTAGTVTLDTGSGIVYIKDTTCKIQNASGTLRIFNDGLNQSIWMKVNDGGVSKTIFYAKGSNGYLGINDTSPTYQLDVTGDGRFTGDLQLDSDLQVDGNVDLGTTEADTVVVDARMQHRSVTDTGPMADVDGNTREIVYNTSDSKFYGCTAGGSPATWVALH
jgi:hypothetical protein